MRSQLHQKTVIFAQNVLGRNWLLAYLFFFAPKAQALVGLDRTIRAKN
jgi:hypothetical protein